MDKVKLSKHLVFLMFFIFIANIIALKFYWYYTIWYFDMIMHFLGGLWVGLFFIWFCFEKVATRSVIKTLLFVLLIGVLYEFFELYTNNYIGREPFSILDTTSDVFFDLAGGGVAFLYFSKRVMRTYKNDVQLS